MVSNKKIINKKVVELIETYNFYFSYFPSDLFEQFKIRILKYERCITFVLIISNCPRLLSGWIDLWSPVRCVFIKDFSSHVFYFL